MAISIMGGIDGITVETDPTALKLTGGTLTGKVNFSPVAGVAGLNIGTGGTDAASTTAGDLWITTGGSTLNYRDGLGSWRILASRNLANTFTFSQTISATDATNPMLSVTQNGNGGGLRVTNNGTGHTILIEDSTNPDSTPFVVTNSGQAVFGGLTPYSTATLTVKGGASIESGSYYVRVDSSGVGMYGQLVLTNQTTVSGTANFNDYNNDLAVTVNGQTIYIPYRV